MTNCSVVIRNAVLQAVHRVNMVMTGIRNRDQGASGFVPVRQIQPPSLRQTTSLRKGV